MEIISKRLKALRESVGLSQNKFAQISGMKQSSINRYENGSVTPSPENMVRLADLFDRVQERMEKNKKAPAQRKAEDDYLLTTKLFCGTCGAFMVGEIGTSKYQSRKYRYYRCVNTKRKKTCNAKHKSVRKDKIEYVVIKYVKEMISDDDFVKYFTEMAYKTQGQDCGELPMITMNR